MVRITEMLETHVYLMVQIERGRVAGRTVVVGVQRGAGQLVVHVQMQIVRTRTQLQVVIVALFVVIVTCLFGWLVGWLVRRTPPAEEQRTNEREQRERHNNEFSRRGRREKQLIGRTGRLSIQLGGRVGQDAVELVVGERC